jgi:hypothetical protein
LLNHACLKEQGANFSYVFRKDCASQKRRNYRNLLSPLRALAQPAVELYSMLKDEFGCWINHAGHSAGISILSLEGASGT